MRHTAGGEAAASTTVLRFSSAGVDLPGVLYLPPGAGPHPVVVVLPGFPGYGCDFDLVRALGRARYAALVFNCRGSWGIAGSWSISNMLDDAVRVTAAIKDKNLVGAHRLDPERLVMLGHSLGGFAALMTAAADPSITAVISVAAPDIGSVAAAFGADPRALATHLAARDSQPPGPALTAAPSRFLPPPSGESVLAEAGQAGETWRLTALGPRLASRPVLLIGTSHGTGTPPAVHHHPVVSAYLGTGGPRLEHHVFATDNSLSDHRKALVHTVLDFLRRNLPKPG